jgi:hypothetical protein
VRGARCHARGGVTQPSTVDEHPRVTARAHASANAPGRTEGSREHGGLAVTRTRDERHGRGLEHAALAVTRTRGTPRPHDASTPSRLQPLPRGDVSTTAGIDVEP